MTTQNIDPQGDVILVVGPDHGRLRVSSLFMSKASKAFRAMFSGHSAEGIGLSTAAPKEVELPEDDYDSMRIICKVSRLENDGIPDFMPADKILRLAVMVDKYDCSKAMSLASNMYLTCYSDYQFERAWAQMTAAAYFFSQSDHFRDFTRKLSWSAPSSIELLKLDNLESPPFFVFILVDRQRHNARKGLIEQLSKYATCKGCGQPKCRYGLQSITKFKEVVQQETWKRSIGGIAALSVEKAFSMLEGLDEERWLGSDDACVNCEDSMDVSDYPWGITDDLNEVDCAGLCLRCVRHGSDEAMTCNGIHKDENTGNDDKAQV